MPMPDRRLVLGGMAASIVMPRIARAATVRDGAGREVAIPARVERVFPAGPPAAIVLYTLAPDLLLGWPRANRPEEREFLLPGVGDKPEVGRITGRGNSANLEAVLSLKPDLIVDAGSTGRTYVDLATRVQEQTGIPYALLDGRFDQIPASYRILGQLLGRSERAEALARWCETTMGTIVQRIARIPAERRPSVYYARGPRGLETGLGGSINVETLTFVGARNVADTPGNGLAQVSLEQVLAWNPDVIVTIDQSFAETVRTDPAWAEVRAVRDGRIHLSPKLPFGWVDFPPSVNRMIGLWWLAKILYPAEFPEDIRPLAREFHTLFYQVTPSEAQLDRILSGRA
ncbi:iron ABC transporter substrate-binding protein [Bosea sp. BK604]|uniref:iron ABC transporter substrate-binding protein n=1 Tax=Bosea sp. BK604 TaxID=2512180 RepID=UPI0010DCDCB1|nr:iron ABC transporter substrate-binding protein [Bosea sp. BK604]TCR67594.1 iron complex transport system substrate-binding protein [Bosea sp. BK604]